MFTHSVECSIILTTSAISKQPNVSFHFEKIINSVFLDYEWLVLHLLVILLCILHQSFPIPQKHFHIAVICCYHCYALLLWFDCVSFWHKFMPNSGFFSNIYNVERSIDFIALYLDCHLTYINKRNNIIINKFHWNFILCNVFV